MNRNKRDIVILKKIVKYCGGIESSINRFGDNVAALETDADYKDSVSMKIFQIGELTSHLSDEFKDAHKEIPWRSIKNMRNIAAHQYENFDNEYIWETMKKDIPALRDYCNKIINTELSENE